MALAPFRIVAALAIGLAVLALCLVLSRTGAGFDLSDEGFYFNWMQNPWEYPAVLTFFGYIYRPLFLLLEGDVALLRQANLLITFILSAWLIKQVQLAFSDADRPWRLTLRTALIIPLALACWMLARWLSSPSYNWLTLQGLLLAANGGVRLLALPRAQGERPSPHAVLKAGLLLGLGGFLAAGGKPASGAVLAGIVVVTALPFTRARFLALVVAFLIASACVAALIWFVDGTITGFVARIRLGLELMAQLDGGQRLLRLDRIPRLSFADVAAMVAFGSMAYLLAGYRPTPAGRGSMILAGCAAIAVGVWLWRGNLMPWPNRWGVGLLMASGLGGVLLRTVSVGVIRRHWRLALFLALLPVAFTAGTGNSVWDALPLGLIFWVALAAGLLSAAAPDSEGDMPLAASALVVALAAGLGLAITMERPYRQATPLRQQGEEVTVGQARARLLLDRPMAAYVTTLRTAIGQAAQPGVGVLDLTGQSPGTIYIVGGTALAAPWLIGGYRGSAAMATRQIGLVPCPEIGRAWLLLADRPDESFLEAFLAVHGIAFATAYAEAGQARSPRDGAIHRLYRPAVAPQAITEACHARRMATPPVP